MTVTRAQLGTFGSTTTLATVTCTLGSATTPGNLLLASATSGAGHSTLSMSPGWVELVFIGGGTPNYVAFWAKIADGTESGATLTTTNAAPQSLTLQVQEFTGLSTDRALPAIQDAIGTALTFSASNAPGAYSAPVAVRSGAGLAVALFGSNAGGTSFTGFAASGWAAEVYGHAADAWQAIVLTAAVTQASITATWTTARTGTALIIVFSPPSSFRPQVVIT